MGHGCEFESDIKQPMKLGDFYWPAMPEPDNQDLFSPAPPKEFLEDWLARNCELVEKYKPSMVYFDWWIQHDSVKEYLKKFAAYYYNRANEWGMKVAYHINRCHDAWNGNTRHGARSFLGGKIHFTGRQTHLWHSIHGVILSRTDLRNQVTYFRIWLILSARMAVFC